MSSSLDVAASNLKKMNTASSNQYLPLHDCHKRAQALRAHRQGVVEDEYKLQHLIPPAASSSAPQTT